MIQEDQSQMCSNNNNSGVGVGVGVGVGGSGSGDGGSINRPSSKKSKQKKVPQRGLGVAQLEKIRLEEEQQMIDGNILPSPTTLSPTNFTSQYPIPLPNYPLTNNQQSSLSCVPFSPPSPPPMPMNLPPPNPIFRTHSLPNTENFHSSSIPCLNLTNSDGFQAKWPSIPVNGNVGFSKMWHSNTHDFSPDHKGENSIFSPNLSLPYETYNVAPLPDVLPRSSQQHQPPSSNSFVNVLSSSSVLNFPVEPPSNQSFYSNYSPLWPEEEKMMVGMKRSCPFPLDSTPIPIFHSKYAASPVATHPLNRSDESTSGRNGGTTNKLESNIPIVRDISSCPSVMPEPTNSRRIISSENRNSHTDEFLSLAPPPTTSSFPISRFKKFCQLDTLPYQASNEDQLMDSRQGDSSLKPNLLSFLPSTKLQATTSASPPANHSNCNNEIGESIDLNLRL